MKQRGKFDWIDWILIIICFGGFILLMLTTGCSKNIYVPVESVNKDSIYINEIRHDSIYYRDSIYVYNSPDSIHVEKYVYRNKYFSIHDTTSIIKIDSIRVPYPVDVIKEVNVITGFQNFQMWTGRILGLILILWVFFRIRKK
jgi:hypothetical protein